MNFRNENITTSVGSVSRSALSEMLVHKKLEKMDENLALIAMRSSVNAAENSCDASISIPSHDYPEESNFSAPTKALKSCRFEHFSKEIRQGNHNLHHMSKGLTTVRELWMECSVGINDGPDLRDLE